MSMQLLPPGPGLCPKCATKHTPAEPHNAQSLYYGVRFKMLHGREPTWADAIAHCSEATQTVWREELKRQGHWTEPTELQALTVLDPWATAIGHMGKDVENRTWTPPAAMRGAVFLVHCGKGTSEWREYQVDLNSPDLQRREVPEYIKSLVRLCNTFKDPPTAGYPAATVRLVGLLTHADDPPQCFVPGYEDACAKAKTSPWYMGQIAFVLADPVTYCAPLDDPSKILTGKQGFWKVPPEVASDLLVHRAQVLEDRHGNKPLVDHSQPRVVRMNPHRHAPTQPVKMVRLAHPDPDLLQARLNDLEDLGFANLASEIYTASKLPAPKFLAEIKERQERLRKDLDSELHKQMESNALRITCASAPALTILQDLIDDMEG